MTMPNERAEAVLTTHEFLRDLLDPKKTPRVPSAVRRAASRCLRHYPTDYHMHRSKELAPEVWGTDFSCRRGRYVLQTEDE